MKRYGEIEHACRLNIVPAVIILHQFEFRLIRLCLCLTQTLYPIRNLMHEFVIGLNTMFTNATLNVLNV